VTTDELQGKPGIIAGCVLRFGVPIIGAEVHNERLLGKILKFLPGCLVKDGFDILLLPDHFSRTVIARTSDGSLTVRETSDGLYFGAQMPEKAACVEAFTNIRGSFLGCSMGIERLRCRDVGEFHGYPLVEISQITLRHIALTWKPAYRNAWVRGFNRRYDRADWFDDVLKLILDPELGRYIAPWRDYSMGD